MTRLKYERIRQGLSQDRLGQMANLYQSDLGLVETLRLQPTPAQLELLAVALQVPSCELLKEIEIVRPEMVTA